MGVLNRNRPTVNLSRCPRCKAPGAGPFVWRGVAHAVCDADRVRWRTDLSERDASALNVARLHYEGVDR